MLERWPKYYGNFACIAAACPDPCCVGWDVVVDDTAAARWAQYDDALGTRLREVLVVDEDGDRVMRMEADGRCPMFCDDGLCRLQRERGHDALCRTCREYPRLRQDYDVFVEHGLALSCPAAAEWILSSTDDGWVERGTVEDAPVDYDPALMALLQQTRGQLLELLRDESRPVGESLSLALLYAYAVQDAIDGEEFDFDPERELAALPAPQPRDFAPMVEFHRGLEMLTDRWAARLDAARLGAWPAVTRALAAYYVNRYWLQAVSDRDVLWRTKQMLAACLMARALPDLADIVLYSKEVEHDPDNVDCIWDATFSDPAWTDLALLDWLRG